MSFRLIAALAGTALLAGCQSDPLPQAGSLDAGFGEVSRYNAAVQTINPDPVYTADGAQAGDNGEKAADATKRYRTGENNDQHRSEARQKGTQSTTSGSGGPR
jgi:outer membrane murein-binding lipoprotein Lpp